MKRSRLIVAALFAVLLAAVTFVSCGGGGGGGPEPNPQAPTYAIGGVVSGLSGTGLVLRNNAADDLGIASSGTFTFAAKLAVGTAYSVTVKTHPTSLSQLCTVSNGTGTVAAADVHSVLVSCATRTFSIGGVVSGLRGGGLTLLNNGGNSLAVVSSGTFSFTTRIPDGALYSVTVGTHPTAPAQNCVVSNGSGTVNGGRIATVAIACTTLPQANGSLCASNAECTSGMCECADPACAAKRCSAVSCGCQYVNVMGTGCASTLSALTDPLNACPGFTCDGFGACLTSCSFNAECDSDRYCAAPSCLLKSPLGASCTVGSDCISWFCVSGHCCEGSCVGGTCDAAGKCTGLPQSATCTSTDQCGAGLFCDTTGVSVCCESQCSSLLGTCTMAGDCIGLPLGVACAVGDAQCANGGGVCPDTGSCP